MENSPRLAQALVQRDRDAWATMYDRHVGAVFGLIFHLAGRNGAVAEDVNQEVWLLAIEQIDKFDSTRGEFRDWLMGIARHRALRRRRDAARVYASRPGGPSDPLPPPELLEGAERVDMVRAALLLLHDEWRQALLAKYVEGLSVAQIASRMGRTVKAAESVLSRARQQIRALLQPYFANPSGLPGPASHPLESNIHELNDTK